MQKGKQERQRKKPKVRTARRLTRLHSEITLEALQWVAADQLPPQERQEGLPLKDIHVAPLVFQWRLADEELAADERHVWDLVHAITSGDKPRPLTDILVAAIGNRFYVLDGHHRLDAYHTARWKGLVPVEYFHGTLREAVTEALKRNAKNQLPMTRASKTEAAWRMLVAGWKTPAWKRTWTDIMELTTAGRSTLQRMTEVFKKLGATVLKGTWEDARRALRETQFDAMSDDERRDWEEEKARRLADYFLEGPSLTKDPGVTARALEMVSGSLPDLLVSQWAELATERLLTEVAECMPEKAQVVEDVLTALRTLGAQQPDASAVPKGATINGD